MLYYAILYYDILVRPTCAARTASVARPSKTYLPWPRLWHIYIYIYIYIYIICV